jgi:hypothetical protein
MCVFLHSFGVICFVTLQQIYTTLPGLVLVQTWCPCSDVPAAKFFLPASVVLFQLIPGPVRSLYFTEFLTVMLFAAASTMRRYCNRNSFRIHSKITEMKHTIWNFNKSHRGFFNIKSAWPFSLKFSVSSWEEKMLKVVNLRHKFIGLTVAQCEIEWIAFGVWK